MSRAVVVEAFGGPEALEVREVPEPHAGPGQLRVRVSAAGLNPVDWKLVGSPQASAAYGVTLPSGFGNDYAGVVDEVGAGVTGFTVGDRVFGGARGHAVADHTVVDPAAVTAPPLVNVTPPAPARRSMPRPDVLFTGAPMVAVMAPELPRASR